MERPAVQIQRGGGEAYAVGVQVVALDRVREGDSAPRRVASGGVKQLVAGVYAHGQAHPRRSGRARRERNRLVVVYRYPQQGRPSVRPALDWRGYDAHPRYLGRGRYLEEGVVGYGVGREVENGVRAARIAQRAAVQIQRVSRHVAVAVERVQDAYPVRIRVGRHERVLELQYLVGVRRVLSDHALERRAPRVVPDAQPDGRVADEGEVLGELDVDYDAVARFIDVGGRRGHHCSDYLNVRDLRRYVDAAIHLVIRVVGYRVAPKPKRRVHGGGASLARN